MPEAGVAETGGEIAEHGTRRHRSVFSQTEESFAQTEGYCPRVLTAETPVHMMISRLNNRLIIKHTKMLGREFES